LRLQIVVALAGLMALAFGPLFFAVASLTRATVASSQEEAALAVGRAVEAHLTDARAIEPASVARVLREHVPRDVEAACLFATDGSAPVCEGTRADALEVSSRASTKRAFLETFRGERGREIVVGVPTADGFLVMCFRPKADVDRGTPLLRLVALYTGVFALALLVFTYFALTQVIVRPVERLVEAADRVESGVRTLRFPSTGARELVRLGASVHAMAEKLLADEASLRRKVQELTETTGQLKQTQAQLVRSERMASVGRLGAGLAHEIGNPLAALMGLQELMLDSDLPRDAERDLLKRMRAETERINTVVRDLLDFARPEGTRQVGDPPAAPADVAAVVDDVLALLSPQKPFRGVALTADVEKDLRVTLSSPRLTQVLLNIVLNAGAAIASKGPRGGRIMIRARAVDAAHACIDVEDDGPGIADSVLGRLFEPFVTTKSIGEGTGLGLAVCRGLVESSGGEIGVRGSSSQGATFYVVLPRG